MSRTQMNLMAFVRPTSLHPAGWRDPANAADGNTNLDVLIDAAKRLEAACFDGFFYADHVGVLAASEEVLQATDSIATFEPFTILSAISQHTSKIGLVATASATFTEPFNMARMLASLDHLSRGRAGWNIVTTWITESAANFGLENHPDHATRYQKAREYFDVVSGLWDSFADDAFVRDQDSGVFSDPKKIYRLNHKGRFYSVSGPLNAMRPVQGWPVIIQAGASEDGRQFAAEVTEVIFGAATTIEAGLAFRDDLHARMREAGRDPDDLRILPGALVVVGDTDEAAQEKRAWLNAMVPYAMGLRSLTAFLGQDVSQCDPDGPLPEIAETNAIKSAQQRIIQEARDKKLTIRQLVAWVSGYRGLALVGSPQTIADEMERWFTVGAADGFNLIFTGLPGGLTDFCDKVVPLLQARGLFKTSYHGSTLREHLGLKRPPNQFFADGTVALDPRSRALSRTRLGLSGA
ncbi:alkanesulfonate monooxygenase [Sphingomonas vulcanisoli]|uniref:Alkanesulfonate monooxygenase n=1 Tax=Sphingomonas vulcanisoli TaxID=1658060 RepID=A0ABX0TSJ8_9SPHN|nr:LLM class flavin-dependent oxidoreductase [Sphingomonas vulcanisoli]NIJ08499.1 alkanesulfonate monooxygenase [Sphingomonas vulcanisoli]